MSMQKALKQPRESEHGQQRRIILQISSVDLAEMEDSPVLKDLSKRVADSVEMEKSSV